MPGNMKAVQAQVMLSNLQLEEFSQEAANAGGKVHPEQRPALSKRCSFRASVSFRFEEWVIPSDYDYTKSTQENYKAAPGNLTTTGKFKDIRDTRDVDYHGNYTLRRQGYQDTLVRNVVEAACPKAHPWIVFTAGAMGAGKSHTLNWMNMNQYFPLPDIVQIDPDVFKLSFPEWPEYVRRDQTSAGSLTRRESGYLVEIAQEAAMRMYKNVWVDGSFRDAEWYEKVFREIRQEHPGYRIAILYVYADPEVVCARAAQRALETGRHVPEKEIMDSLERVPASVARLGDKADFVAYIQNNGTTPRLTDFCTRQGCYANVLGSWQEISVRFATSPAFQDSERWRRFLEQTIPSKGVFLVSKTYCSFCAKARKLLKQYGVPYSTLELDRPPEGICGVGVQLELQRITHSTTVPQMFVDGKYIGGCDDIYRMHKDGALWPLIRAYSTQPDKEQFLGHVDSFSSDSVASD